MVAGGAVVGVVDLFSLEVWPAVAGMSVFGVALGLLRPRQAPVWAGILGLSVPLAHLLAAAVGVKPPYVVLPSRWATLLALVPACLATLLGVAASWVWARWRRGAAGPQVTQCQDEGPGQSSP